MTDNEIIKALGSMKFGGLRCLECNHKRVKGDNRCGIKGCRIAQYALDLINRQKAEVERLQKRRKPTETSGFKIENGRVVFYTNILNGYRNEYKDLDEVVEELNLLLQESYKADDIAGHLKTLQEQYKTAKSEAVREFADKVNLIVEELVDIMFDGNETKCKISNCHKHSSIPCESPTCIEENKAYWKVRILNLVKEMVGDENG